MITKEQIEGMKANARDFAIWAVDGVHGYTCEHSTNPQGHIDEYDKHEKDFLALCDLALLAVALKPRPLAEIDKSDTALVIHKDPTGLVFLNNLFALRCYGSGHWRTSAMGKDWPDTTLAIPLSALAGLMEGKPEPVPMLQKHQPCGCIVCTCEDEERCHGCGAKHCGTHPVGKIPNPVYELESPAHD